MAEVEQNLGVRQGRGVCNEEMRGRVQGMGALCVSAVRTQRGCKMCAMHVASRQVNVRKGMSAKAAQRKGQGVGDEACMCHGAGCPVCCRIVVDIW